MNERPKELYNKLVEHFDGCNLGFSYISDPDLPKKWYPIKIQILDGVLPIKLDLKVDKGLGELWYPDGKGNQTWIGKDFNKIAMILYLKTSIMLFKSEYSKK